MVLIMSYQLTDRPYKFSFTRNPVKYKVEVSNPATPGCAVEVELYTLPIDEVFDEVTNPGTLLTRQSLFPNPDGTVYFFAEDFLDAATEWQMPTIYAGTIPGSVQAVKDQIIQYYIRYRQVSTANTETTWATDSANIRKAIKGGVAKEKFDYNNFFINHLATAKPFLTWQPDGHLIGRYEFRYLTYLHHSTDDVVLKLKARVVYLDGTEEIVLRDFPALSESLLFHLPVSIEQLSAVLSTDKSIWYYDVSVLSEDGLTTYANVYRLYADYRNYYNDFSFVYHNSISGIDTMRVRGEYDLEVIRDFKEIQQAIQYGDAFALLPTENSAVNISKYELYKGDAGWMNTRAMQDSMQEILLSDSVWRILHNRWLRVMHLQKNQTMGGTDDTKWSFPLQWRYTFDNTSYTPFTKDLGQGSNTEDPGDIYGVCTAPGSLVAELIGDDGGGKKYTFTWDDVADALSYELDYKMDGAATWTTVECSTFTKDITFMVAGNYSWRVRSKCDVNDFSSYSIGAGFTVDIDVPVCSAPASLSVALQIITSLIADIKFTWPAVGGVVGYILEARMVGTTVWSSWTLGLVTEYTATFLPNIQYECRIRSICNATPDYSGFIYGPSFIPSNMVGSCSAPTGLYVTMGGAFLSHRRVRFFWTNAPNATNYQLEYRYVDVVVWTIVTCQSGEDRNIHVDRNIVWRVRSNCNDGGVSAFTNGAPFTT